MKDEERKPAEITLDDVLEEIKLNSNMRNEDNDIGIAELRKLENNAKAKFLDMKKILHTIPISFSNDLLMP